MLSFTPSLPLERELKRLQALLVQSCQALEGISAEEASYLNHFALISNVGASTRIENAVLTDQEIAWVDTTLHGDGKTTAFEEHKAHILDKLSKDRARSVEEVVGCRQILLAVYLQSKELFPLTETIVRGLHHDLLRYYPDAAGHAGGYKKTPNRVVFHNHDTGEKRIVMDPAPPGVVTETAMSETIKWYNETMRIHPWPLLVATEFVFRFLAIHPFQDGNGRLGRALFVLSLLHSEDPYLSGVTPYVAIDRHIERNRPTYYSVLHRCSAGVFRSDPTNYELEPLAWFFLKIIESSLADIAFYRRRYTNLLKLSPSAISVLDCFNSTPERRLKVAGIVKETGLPRRTVQYALKSLASQEFIQLLGKGPASRYQLVF